MKKSLIALAVAGAFGATAAMADVTIYGVADVSYDSVSSGSSGSGTAGYSATQVSSNQSRIGFKGTEDLGGGTSALFQIEQAVAMDTGAWGGARNTFAGLSSTSMGTLILGNHDTPYKMAARGIDVFADSIADNRSLMGQTGGGAFSHDQRLGNVVAYISPDMSGFKAAIAYVAAAEGPTQSASTKASAWSLAGMYNAGPINAALGYQVIDGGSTIAGNTLNPTPPAAALAVLGNTGEKLSAWRLSGGYTMDAFTVNAAYEATTSSGAILGSSTKQNNFYLAGKFAVSASDAVKLAYTSAGKTPQGGGVGAVDVVNSEATQLSVGYDHDLSKRTQVYALYTRISNKGNNAAGSAYNLFGNPLAQNGNGASPAAFSLGMKHSF